MPQRRSSGSWFLTDMAWTGICCGSPLSTDTQSGCPTCTWARIMSPRDARAPSSNRSTSPCVRDTAALRLDSAPYVELMEEWVRVSVPAVVGAHLKRKASSHDSTLAHMPHTTWRKSRTCLAPTTMASACCHSPCLRCTCAWANRWCATSPNTWHACRASFACRSRTGSARRHASRPSPMLKRRAMAFLDPNPSRMG